MRRPDKSFDPFTEVIVDGIVANAVRVKVGPGRAQARVSWGRDSQQPPHPPGPPGDLGAVPVRQEGGHLRGGGYVRPPCRHAAQVYRTRTSQGNSFNPVWDEEPFDFPKVSLAPAPSPAQGAATQTCRALLVGGREPGALVVVGDVKVVVPQHLTAGPVTSRPHPGSCMSQHQAHTPFPVWGERRGQEAETAGGPTAPVGAHPISQAGGTCSKLTPASPCPPNGWALCSLLGWGVASGPDACQFLSWQ